MLDVFKADAFSTASLTAAIDMLPFKPARLGAMGLFQRKPRRKVVVAFYASARGSYYANAAR